MVHLIYRQWGLARFQKIRVRIPAGIESSDLNGKVSHMLETDKDSRCNTFYSETRSLQMSKKYRPTLFLDILKPAHCMVATGCWVCRMCDSRLPRQRRQRPQRHQRLWRQRWWWRRRQRQRRRRRQRQLATRGFGACSNMMIKNWFWKEKTYSREKTFWILPCFSF